MNPQERKEVFERLRRIEVSLARLEERWANVYKLIAGIGTLVSALLGFDIFAS